MSRPLIDEAEFPHLDSPMSASQRRRLILDTIRSGGVWRASLFRYGVTIDTIQRDLDILWRRYPQMQRQRQRGFTSQLEWSWKEGARQNDANKRVL